MRQLGALRVGAERLVRLEPVLVVVGVALDFEHKGVGEPLRCVPRVHDCCPLVLARGYFFASQSVVLDIVYYFQSELLEIGDHHPDQTHTQPPVVDYKAHVDGLRGLAPGYLVPHHTANSAHGRVLLSETVLSISHL